MSGHIFLIDYLCDSQPMHLEAPSDVDTTTVEQAQAHVRSLGAKGTISSVQVSKITRTHEAGTSPGHHQQP